MENETIRVKTSPNDGNKYLNIKLEQDFEELKILSLTLKQQDIYQNFSSDYGVVVGRVLSNQGVGLPNAKVNVFIPISSEDESNQQIKSIYPFKNVTDKRGLKRFNLLSKIKQISKFSGWDENSYGVGYTPPTPNGSQPSKIELLANKTHIEVYKKYLKFSTVTNESGDYMIFGAPVGQQTIHVDVDLTDIGLFSMSPKYMSKVLGYPDNLFDEDGGKIKKLDNLNNLPNIQSQNKIVNVRPFWGDSNVIDEIGITRVDFDLPTDLSPTFTIFGSTLTQGKSSWWGDRILLRLFTGVRNLCLQLGNVDINIGGDPCSFGSEFCFALGFRFFFEGLSIRSRVLKVDLIPSFDLTQIFGGNKCKPTNVSMVRFGPFGFGFTLKIGIGVRIPNILPFIRIQSGNRYCGLVGGKLDLNPIDFVNLGRTCACSVQSALQNLSRYGDGLTDKADLSTHRNGDLNAQLYEISSDIPNLVADQLNQGINITNYNIDNDIRLLNNNEYVLYNDNGSFVIELGCNRTKVITSDDGSLIEVDNDSEKGVFIGWRGYMLASIGNLPIDNPPTRNQTARVQLKIPTSFDYHAEGPNLNRWAFEHYYFEAGNIYSVSTFIRTRLDGPLGDQFQDCQSEKSNSFDFNLTKADQNNGWEQNTGLILSVEYGGYLDETSLPASEQMWANRDTCLSSTVNNYDPFVGDEGVDPDDQNNITDPPPFPPPRDPSMIDDAQTKACGEAQNYKGGDYINIEDEAFNDDKNTYIDLNDGYTTAPNISLVEINNPSSLYYYDPVIYKEAFKVKFIECFTPELGIDNGSSASLGRIDRNDDLTIEPTIACVISQISTTDPILQDQIDSKCLAYKNAFIVGYIGSNEFIFELGKQIGINDGNNTTLKDDNQINNSIPSWVSTLPTVFANNSLPSTVYYAELRKVNSNLNDLVNIQTSFRNGYYDGYLSTVNAYLNGRNDGQVAATTTPAIVYTTTPSYSTPLCNGVYSLNSSKCGEYRDGHEYGYFYQVGRNQFNASLLFPSFSNNWSSFRRNAFYDGYYNL